VPAALAATRELPQLSLDAPDLVVLVNLTG